MESKTNILGTMNIRKLLIKMSLPTIISLLIAALYNVVDAGFVGAHSEATLGLGGLTVAFPVQLLLISIGQLFGMGAASLFSRRAGEKDFELANKTIANAYVYVLVTGLVLSVLGTIFTEDIMRFVGASEEVLPLASVYSRIILVSSVVHIFANASTHIVRAEGSALCSMLFMSVGSVLNIPLDYLFVLHFDMGVKGASIATVISTMVSCILFVVYILSKKSMFKFSKSSFKLDKKLLGSITGVGFPGFAINTLGIVVMLIINLTIKRFDSSSLFAVTGLINRIMGLVIMPLCGIMYGLLPIISYNYGAGNVKRIFKSVKFAVILSTGLCIVCFFVIMLLSDNIVGIFIKPEDSVYEIAVNALRTVTIALPISGVCILTSGICQGVGETKGAAIAAVAKNILLVVLILVLSPGMGFVGIVWALPISDALSFVISVIILVNTMRRLKSNVGEVALAAV